MEEFVQSIQMFFQSYPYIVFAAVVIISLSLALAIIRKFLAMTVLLVFFGFSVFYLYQNIETGKEMAGQISEMTEVKEGEHGVSEMIHDLLSGSEEE